MIKFIAAGKPLLFGFCTKQTAEYLYGVNPIQIALSKKRRTFQVLFISNSKNINVGSKIKNITVEAQSLNIPIKFESKDRLNKLVNNQPHQNLVLKCSKLKPEPAKQPRQYSPGIYLYCDKITDPQNFGSIIRSSSFFGFRDIFVPKKQSCPLNSTVSKTSAGALQLINIYSVDKQQLFLEQWKEDSGFVITTQVSQRGLTVNLQQLAKQIQGESKILVILGSEGAGVSNHLSKHANLSLTIPRAASSCQAQNLVDSLNVSSALTCILYELSKLK